MEIAPHRYFSRRWMVGTILILVGLLLFLMNLGMIERFPIWKFFPLLLIAAGISRMLESYRRAEGFWFLALGIWLQASFLRLGGLSFRDTWPAVLIAFGVYLIWQSAERASRARAKQQDVEYVVHQSTEHPDNQ